MDKLIQPILEKALAGQRLNFDDSLSLFRSFDLISIGNAADQVRQPGGGDGRCLDQLPVAG